jgi:hypothetical protein
MNFNLEQKFSFLVYYRFTDKYILLPEDILIVAVHFCQI